MKVSLSFLEGDDCEDFEESVDINEAFQTSVAVGKHGFSRMEVDVDARRRQHMNIDTSQENLRLDHQKRLETLGLIRPLCFFLCFR